MRGGIVIFTKTFIYDDAQFSIVGEKGKPVGKADPELVERLVALGLVTTQEAVIA